MRKRLISITLVLMIILTSAVTTYAGGGTEVEVRYLDREITVNGNFILNYQSDHPYFVYNTIIYVPITWENCKIFGYQKVLDNEWNPTLIREKPSQANYAEQWLKNNGPTMTAVVSDQEVIVRTEDEDGEVADVVLTSEVTQGYPILEYRSATYIPLTFNVVNNVLGWKKEYDDFSGLYLDTTGNASEESMIDQTVSQYNQALVNYIITYNKNYTVENATDLVFLVKQNARIYGVDERLILAMIHKESTFYSDIKSSSGAVGYMQIMPATGRIYGVTTSQLYDPNINISLGTNYISTAIEGYGGLEKGLVAYNAGGSAVRNGRTTSSYSQTVVKYYNNLVSATTL